MSMFYDDTEARRKRLGLDPDINRRILAIRVLFGDPLEKHERLFIARLLHPRMAQQKKRGRTRSTATALLADQIAEAYFLEKAFYPHAKHKEEIAPFVARFFNVSVSYVDKVLSALDPKRRKELEF